MSFMQVSVEQLAVEVVFINVVDGNVDAIDFVVLASVIMRRSRRMRR
jgi:hypothetical protein